MRFRIAGVGGGLKQSGGVFEVLIELLTLQVQKAEIVIGRRVTELGEHAGLGRQPVAGAKRADAERFHRHQRAAAETDRQSGFWNNRCARLGA